MEREENYMDKFRVGTSNEERLKTLEEIEALIDKSLQGTLYYKDFLARLKETKSDS